MMVLNNKYYLGQTVYLVTDEDQSPRLVTSLRICVDGLLYQLGCGTVTSDHYEFEISAEKIVVHV